MNFEQEAWIKREGRLGVWVYRRLIKDWCYQLAERSLESPDAAQILEESGLDFAASNQLGAVLLFVYACQHGWRSSEGK
jgi:hypothetical protein